MNQFQSKSEQITEENEQEEGEGDKNKKQIQLSSAVHLCSHYLEREQDEQKEDNFKSIISLNNEQGKCFETIKESKQSESGADLLFLNHGLKDNLQSMDCQQQQITQFKECYPPSSQQNMKLFANHSENIESEEEQQEEEEQEQRDNKMEITKEEINLPHSPIVNTCKLYKKNKNMLKNEGNIQQFSFSNSNADDYMNQFDQLFPANNQLLNQSNFYQQVESDKIITVKSTNHSIQLKSNNTTIQSIDPSSINEEDLLEENKNIQSIQNKNEKLILFNQKSEQQQIETQQQLVSNDNQIINKKYKSIQQKRNLHLNMNLIEVDKNEKENALKSQSQQQELQQQEEEDLKQNEDTQKSITQPQAQKIKGKETDKIKNNIENISRQPNNSQQNCQQKNKSQQQQSASPNLLNTFSNTTQSTMTLSQSCNQMLTTQQLNTVQNLNIPDNEKDNQMNNENINQFNLKSSEQELEQQQEEQNNQIINIQHQEYPIQQQLSTQQQQNQQELNINHQLSDNLILNPIEITFANQLFTKITINQLKFFFMNVIGCFAIYFQIIRDSCFILLSIFFFIKFLIAIMYLCKASKQIFFITSFIIHQSYLLQRSKLKIKQEDLFKAAEIFSFAVFFVGIHMINLNPQFKVVSLISYTPFIHVIWWRTIQNVKKQSSLNINFQLIFRLIMIIQVFAIAIRYDQYIKWPWMAIFVPATLIFIGLGFYLLQLIILTIWHFFNSLINKQSFIECKLSFQNIRKKTFVFIVNGLLWGFVSFSGYSIFYLCCLIGLIKFFDSSSVGNLQYNLQLLISSILEPLLNGLLQGAICNLIIFVFNMLFREKIKIYIAVQNRQRILLNENQHEEILNIPDQIQGIETQFNHFSVPQLNQAEALETLRNTNLRRFTQTPVETNNIIVLSNVNNNIINKDNSKESGIKFKNTHLAFPLFMIQFSSTYYRQAEETSVSTPSKNQTNENKKENKNEENDDEENKKIIYLKDVNNDNLNCDDQEIVTSVPQTQRVEFLASSHEIRQQMSHAPSANRSFQLLESQNKHQNIKIVHKNAEISGISNALNWVGSPTAQKNNQSFRICQQNEQQTENIQQSEKDAQSCQICFEVNADIVLMPCGHGGICYSCTILICSKNRLCYLCRKEIENIYQIDISSNNKYHKVLGVTILEQ